MVRHTLQYNPFQVILNPSVISTCAELDIAIIAYSPLGHGFLTGQMGKLDDQDWRKGLTRFQSEVRFALVYTVEMIIDTIGSTRLTI